MVNVPFGRDRLFTAVKGKPVPEFAQAFGCASWAQFFLKYVLANEAVTCPIPGMAKAQYVEDNLGARARAPAGCNGAAARWRPSSMRFDIFCSPRGAAFLVSNSRPSGSGTIENPKKIGIVGGGQYRRHARAVVAQGGYEVFFASRHPEELKPLIEELGPKARAGTPAEAFRFGNAVLIAVPTRPIRTRQGERRRAFGARW